MVGYRWGGWLGSGFGRDRFLAVAARQRVAVAVGGVAYRVGWGPRGVACPGMVQGSRYPLLPVGAPGKAWQI